MLSLEDAIQEVKQLAAELRRPTTPQLESDAHNREAVAARLPPARLTERELEVLRFVAHGMTSAKVAEKLVISPVTVSAHLRSIYSKLGVNSRTAATRFAMEHGII